jgi:cysteine synthase A
MPRIAADVTWLIGRTPLVELTRVSPPGSRIIAKLEAWSPTGSHRDRAALAMIQQAELQGSLQPSGTIVECSSGDLGLAIAMVGRRRGYRVILTMPEWPNGHRAALLRALGAEIATTPAELGMHGAMQRADQLAKQLPGAVCLQAFTNRANSRCHAETTAREIWADTDGQVGLVVAPVGTGGTAAGCASFFRELRVPVFGVEPAASPVLSGGCPGHHDIPGIGAGFIPEILVPGDLAGVIQVTDQQAVAATRVLHRQESLLAGPASGAVLHAAIELAHQPEHQGKLIVAILPDNAERYLDHQAMQQEL